MPFRKKKHTHDKKRERAYKLLEEIDNKPVAQPIVMIREKEIIKEETQMVNCQYCGALMKSSEVKCSHCGAMRRKI